MPPSFKRQALSEFGNELAYLLVTKARLSGPAARQTSDVLIATVEDYMRDRAAWTAYAHTWDAKRERAWLNEVLRSAERLEESLGRRRSERYRKVDDQIVLLQPAMDVYGLSDGGAEWLKSLKQQTIRLAQHWKRSPRERHRRKDLWRHQLEFEVAFELREAGIRLTKAKTGILALVFEKIHALIGLPEIDPHKSVRRACDRLARPSAVAVSELTAK